MQETKTRLKVGEETTYRGYPIVKESRREVRVSFYVSTLKEAKAAVDFMIAQNCLKGDKPG